MSFCLINEMHDSHLMHVDVKIFLCLCLFSFLGNHLDLLSLARIQREYENIK